MSFIKNAWYVAAHARELDEAANGMVSRIICDEPVVMFRDGKGGVAALRDRYPHRLVPLSMGKCVGDSVRCGYHGLRFGTDGACVDAPNDDEQQRARICVQAWRAVERHAVIWLWLGAPEHADEALIPRFDFTSDTALCG